MRFKSTVIKGNRHGSSIGYPTANLGTDKAKSFFDKEGVWAVKVMVMGTWYKGALFWGKRSLFSDKKPVCEILLLDFYESDLYEQVVEVDICDFIREKAAIKNNDELKKLIKEDIEKVEKYFQHKSFN